ncbi:hypothetical protein ILUMI_24461 [Ignelater luminosus]|uniref:Uncharacterized protein n=1 Tax=Ignelater luminosus TaxID=2038154 RepID=A0A8K0G0V9_IGNLU|nr:hypothetical protein ILUMI_24461 [Ignelater luminosus]
MKGLAQGSGVIWNCLVLFADYEDWDETSICRDPSKAIVVGATGFASTRVTSTSGKENITVLFTISASGDKVSPLIIFKDKNIWDQWSASEATAASDDLPAVLIRSRHQKGHLNFLDLHSLLMMLQKPLLRPRQQPQKLLQPLKNYTWNPRFFRGISTKYTVQNEKKIAKEQKNQRKKQTESTSDNNSFSSRSSGSEDLANFLEEKSESSKMWEVRSRMRARCKLMTRESEIQDRYREKLDKRLQPYISEDEHDIQTAWDVIKTSTTESAKDARGTVAKVINKKQTSWWTNDAKLAKRTESSIVKISKRTVERGQKKAKKEAREKSGLKMQENSDGNQKLLILAKGGWEDRSSVGRSSTSHHKTILLTTQVHFQQERIIYKNKNKNVQRFKLDEGTKADRELKTAGQVFVDKHRQTHPEDLKVHSDIGDDSDVNPDYHPSASSDDEGTILEAPKKTAMKIRKVMLKEKKGEKT